MKQLKMGLVLVLSVMLLSLFGLANNSVDAAELESDISPFAYDTYVDITPKNQTKTGSSATFSWNTKHSGGTGVYWVTFSYGDGSKSSVTAHTSTTAHWKKKFSLASGETQRIYTQEANATSSGQPGRATSKSTLKRY
ncbi:hypothetical protein JYK21_02440 [Ralstonia pickettii]|nr:hypothetical protein [Ralstonia pickettii]